LAGFFTDTDQSLPLWRTTSAVQCAPSVEDHTCSFFTESATTGALGSEEDRTGVTATVVVVSGLAWFEAFRPAGTNDAQNPGAICAAWVGDA
jgi:hypothetical protein